MNSLRTIVALGCLAATQATAAPPSDETATSGMVSVPTGVYRPLFRSEKGLKEIPVASFWIDVHPVTNAEFLEFVRANPRWRRSQVKRLFADAQYLQQWAGDLEIGAVSDAMERRPVTFVSWFAAKAYAQWKGRRLPTTSEWEVAAAAGFTVREGEKDTEFRRLVTHWYSTPFAGAPSPVQSGKANYFGVHDLHGLVWEWTSDFNSALVTGDARGDTGFDRQLFCGAGALGASDRGNFPTFMRFGFRNSLKASYALPNLGFRCAKDL